MPGASGTGVTSLELRRREKSEVRLNVFNHSRNSVLNVTESHAPAIAVLTVTQDVAQRTHFVARTREVGFNEWITYTSISDMFLGDLQHWKRE